MNAATEINGRRIVMIDNPDARENHHLASRRNLPFGSARRLQVRKRDDIGHQFVPLCPINGTSHVQFMTDRWLTGRE